VELDKECCEEHVYCFQEIKGLSGHLKLKFGDVFLEGLFIEPLLNKEKEKRALVEIF
jgi:hypothetical protein